MAANNNSDFNKKIPAAFALAIPDHNSIINNDNNHADDVHQIKINNNRGFNNNVNQNTEFPDSIKPTSTEANSTFYQAAFNCTSLLLGLGVLSSPYAMAHAGWVGGGIALVVAAMYAYAMVLMVRCQERTGAGTYQDVVRAAVSRRLRIAIEAFFYMELAGSLMGYCISIADNLGHLFPHSHLQLPGLTPQNVLLLLACLLILPTVWLRDLSALSFTSVWSVLNTFILLGAVLLAATLVDDKIGFHHSIPVVGFNGLPVATGLYAFAFGGTTVFPAIYKSMKEPSRFPQVLMISFGIAIVLVCGLGIIGASMFGSSTASQITLSMPAGKVTTKMVVWLTVLTPMFMFALVMSPISKAMDVRVSRQLKSSPPRLQLIVATLARSALMALILIAAMSLPYFNYVVALIGSSMTIAICLLFPCLFYVLICRDRLTRRSIVAIALVVAFSTVAAVCGTIVSFQGIINSRKHDIATHSHIST